MTFLDRHEYAINKNHQHAELEEKLTLAEQKAHDNWEKSVRALAELDNVRRRAEREPHEHAVGVDCRYERDFP